MTPEAVQASSASIPAHVCGLRPLSNCWRNGRSGSIWLRQTQFRTFGPATSWTRPNFWAFGGRDGPYWILGRAQASGPHPRYPRSGDVTLVEADRRKSAFLAEAARVTETQVSIETCRIESLKPIRAGIITARALAPVEKLLAYGEAYSDESTLYALLKGERADQELTDATTHWKMSVRKVPSRSDSRGTVLLLEGVIHA